MSSIPRDIQRYARQIACEPFGPDGQRRLSEASVLIVGAGGLGSWTAELLARAGVGRLRLADDDVVDWTNLHRQAMYTELDAERKRPKVLAAAEHIGRINASCSVEPLEMRIGAGNIAGVVDGVDAILDGTDNFATRFLVNDYAVKVGLPWVFAGVVAAEGQTMTVVPGRTPCLRCVFDSPPPPCTDPSCRAVGVLGPAVATLASMVAMEGMKLLSGNVEAVSTRLTKLDLWTGAVQRIDAAAAAGVDCPCCKEGVFEYLEP